MKVIDSPGGKKLEFTALERLLLAAFPISEIGRQVIAGARAKQPVIFDAGVYVQQNSSIMTADGRPAKAEVQLVGIKLPLDVITSLIFALTESKKTSLGQALEADIKQAQKDHPELFKSRPRNVIPGPAGGKN